MAKNTEITCASLLASFLSSFLLLSPPSLSANPDNSDTLTKPGKEARFLGLFFHLILLASSSWEPQAFPHTLWLCTQAQLVFPKLLEKLGHRDCRICPNLQQSRQNLTCSPLPVLSP